MRVLHVVKTSDWAEWAPLLAGHLAGMGAEVHVAVPSPEGRQMENWRQSGARIHVAPLDFPLRAPWRLPALCRAARELVDRVKPDLIHSHFVGTTLVLRRALGKKHPVPRIFHVPGPLHLEHRLYRTWELSCAGPQDRWIAMSRVIREAYRRCGVPRERLFLSYCGVRVETYSNIRTGRLRERLGLPGDALVAGNINLMYPPKYYLGQRVGLKNHEGVIDALAKAARRNRRLAGVLIGGPIGGQAWYEQKLRARARASGAPIYLPGLVPPQEIGDLWADFDVCVHAPLSENAGGIHGAMLTGVPVIAVRVGALPEVMFDGLTGKLLDHRRAELLAEALLEVLDNLPAYRAMAERGRAVACQTFDSARTAREVFQIYQHVLDPSRPRPPDFDPRAVVAQVDGLLPRTEEIGVPGSGRDARASVRSMSRST
jgi:glycosyltransferase involved in cell wall biosynthesis